LKPVSIKAFPMHRLHPPTTDVTSSSRARKMFPFCVSLHRLTKHVALMHNTSYSKVISVEEQVNNKHLYCSRKPISVLLIIIFIIINFLIIALNVPFVQIQVRRF